MGPYLTQHMGRSVYANSENPDQTALIQGLHYLPFQHYLLHTLGCKMGLFALNRVHTEMRKQNSRTFPGLFKDFFHFSRTQFLPNFV